MSDPLFSVVVCTYNRAEPLAVLLETGSTQSLPATEYELIIVDNRSTDNTRALVESYCAKFPHVRYVYEEKTGLSPARDRGCREARGEYVAYADDDDKLPPDWLATAKEIVTQRSPIALGGPYYPYYSTPKPHWFKDSYRSGIHADCARNLKDTEYLSGNNMIFRRSALLALGAFSFERGMQGGKFVFGDDTEMQQRLRQKFPNEPIYYDPRLFVYHLAPAYRMTLSGAMRFRFMDGRDSWFTHHRHTQQPATRAKLIRQGFQTGGRFLVDLARGWRRDRSLYPCYQNWLYERAFRHVHTFGNLYGQWSAR